MTRLNPNLWTVEYSDRSGVKFGELYVLGADAKVVSRKATKHIREQLKLRGMRITKLEHVGEIDAF